MSQLEQHNPLSFKFQSQRLLPCMSALGALCAASAFVGFVSPSQAEVLLGDYGALTVGVEASVEANSNIRLNREEESDVIGVVEPRVLYRFDQGALYVDAFVGMEFREYNRHSEYSSQNFKSGFHLEFPYGEADPNLRMTLDGGYNESTNPDAMVQEIVERETYHLNFNAWYYFTERYYLRSGAQYHDQRAVTSGFADIRTFTVPVDFFYRYSEDLALGVGYRYRDTRVRGASPSADSTDHAVYVGAEGRVAPSVDAEVRVGAQRRTFDHSGFGRDTAFFAEALVTWAISDLTTLQLRAGDDFDTSSANEKVDRIYAEVELRHLFTDRITGILGAGYSESDFTLLNGDQYRSDEVWFVTVGVDYDLIEDRLSVMGRLYHADQNSNFANADYKHSVAKVGLSFVY